MTSFRFHIKDWIGDVGQSRHRDPTLAAVSILVESGGTGTCLTEIHDEAAKTVRDHIHVSAHALAQWLLINWWRLRWESDPADRGFDWQEAHSMTGIGDGFSWPPITFSSDGAYVQVTAASEPTPDMSGIRYLQNATVEMPASVFEHAVDEFVNVVIDRCRACGCENLSLSQLRDELTKERSSPEQARACRLQARAGIDAGDASEEWMEFLEELATIAGSNSVEELACILPKSAADFQAIRDGIDSLIQSPQEIHLPTLDTDLPDNKDVLPWETGARLAVSVRKCLGQESFPLNNKTLEDLLQISLPMAITGQSEIRGGYRKGNSNRLKISVSTSREENQRFHLARIMAGSLLAPKSDLFLPVLKTKTAMQKIQRSFAQELLCPWKDLHQFTKDKGFDDESLTEAAEYFFVSEQVVRSALVNKRIIPRERL